jgi:hypothetical protein
MSSVPSPTHTHDRLSITNTSTPLALQCLPAIYRSFLTDSATFSHPHIYLLSRYNPAWLVLPFLGEDAYRSVSDCISEEISAIWTVAQEEGEKMLALWGDLIEVAGKKVPYSRNIPM